MRPRVHSEREFPVSPDWERAVLGLPEDDPAFGDRGKTRPDEDAPDWIFGRNPVWEALGGSRSVLRLLVPREREG